MKLNISPAKNSNHESLTTVSNITPFDNSKAGIFYMKKEKACTRCGIVKPINGFSKGKSSSDGYQTICKYCAKIMSMEYNRTKRGLVRRMYRNQCNSSIFRGHNLPLYTIDQFGDFALSSYLFNKLYENWAMSGYEKDKAPSFDRKDDSIGYSFNNLNRWMTWGENNKKANSNMRDGILIHGTRPQKKIIAINKLTGNEEHYHSMQHAGRKTNISPSNISNCCYGKRKSAGGYIWKFK